MRKNRGLALAVAKNSDFLHTFHGDLVDEGMVGKNSLPRNNTLISMFAKQGLLAKSHQILDNLPLRDRVSWNALISGYVHHEKAEEALNCFYQMQYEGISPGPVTFSCILKACGNIMDVEKGSKIHEEIVSKNLLEGDHVLGTSLVDMYVKCGMLEKARKALGHINVRDVASWNALIGGYAHEGKGHEAIRCFHEMQREGISPDAVTFTCILKACSSIGAIDKGEEIHTKLLSNHVFLHTENVVLSTALMDMYAKCGMLAKARKILDELPFRNTVSWNVLIAEYAQQGQCEEALECFRHMQTDNVPPDAITLACMLKVYGHTGAVIEGKQIHDESIKRGFFHKSVVLASALVDMYAKCGALERAQEVFDELGSVRNVVSWTALIAGYVQQEKNEEAFRCFGQMRNEGICGDTVTFACILKACGNTGAIEKGEQIYNEIINMFRDSLHKNLVLGTALVDMYAKCGMLKKARNVVDHYLVLDVAPWNALITGYSQRGQHGDALKCFELMIQKGISPDVVTFLSVLNACSLSGRLDEAEKHFLDMTNKYGIRPNLHHYTCMVNGFGRVGYFDKVMETLKKMPSCDYLPLWHALLSACSKWGNVELGRMAFNNAIKIDNDDAPAYVLMANIYAEANMNEDAEKIKAMLVETSGLPEPRKQSSGQWR